MSKNCGAVTVRRVCLFLCVSCDNRGFSPGQRNGFSLQSYPGTGSFYRAGGNRNIFALNTKGTSDSNHVSFAGIIFQCLNARPIQSRFGRNRTIRTDFNAAVAENSIILVATGHAQASVAIEHKIMFCNKCVDSLGDCIFPDKIDCQCIVTFVSQCRLTVPKLADDVGNIRQCQCGSGRIKRCCSAFYRNIVLVLTCDKRSADPQGIAIHCVTLNHNLRCRFGIGIEYCFHCFRSSHMKVLPQRRGRRCDYGKIRSDL